MVSAVALCKFVGTISLGLLTGVSYTLSTQSLPVLLTLPSARPAAYTINQTARLATLHIGSLSALSTFSLSLAFFLSPSRARHPYLIWTALIGGISGALAWIPGRRLGLLQVRDEDDINGEQIEKRAREQQRIEGARAAMSGLGLAMAVVGIWGDGA